jgi:2-amino-4-hydroxy-6-hydroxymethyldihydropteridine diphosphokinase
VQTELVTAYIGLGSNLGDRAGNLLLAVRGLLEANFFIHRLSAIYETEPVGIKSETTFLNMVAEVQVSSISPVQMLARMLRIEYLLGRRRENEKTSRTVDLDLLFYGDLQMETDFLTLPHPRLQHRKFVLVPLNELMPNLIHPGLNQTVDEILMGVYDTSTVKRWNP